jgi:hypothetical protein
VNVLDAQWCLDAASEADAEAVVVRVLEHQGAVGYDSADVELVVRRRRGRRLTTRPGWSGVDGG